MRIEAAALPEVGCWLRHGCAALEKAINEFLGQIVRWKERLARGDEKLALPQKLSNEYSGIGDDVAADHRNIGRGENMV